MIELGHGPPIPRPAGIELGRPGPAWRGLTASWLSDARHGREYGRRLFPAAPLKPGWYAVLHCWDSEEGVFPGIRELGEAGFPSSVIARSPGPLADQTAAEAWADRHDPDFGLEPSGWVYL
jgi:hypothetical protein